jgi:excisionase family DNA binding protein
MTDRRTLPPLNPIERYSIDEACAYLRQSRAKTYQDIRDGRLSIIKDGARSYVPGTAIAARSTITA